MYLCENHPFNDDVLPPGVKIPTRIMPLPRIFNNSTTQRRVRDIDVSAPIIYRDTNEAIARLNKVYELTAKKISQIHIFFFSYLHFKNEYFLIGYAAY